MPQAICVSPRTPEASSSAFSGISLQMLFALLYPACDKMAVDGAASQFEALAPGTGLRWYADHAGGRTIAWLEWTSRGVRFGDSDVLMSHRRAAPVALSYRGQDPVDTWTFGSFRLRRGCAYSPISRESTLKSDLKDWSAFAEIFRRQDRLAEAGVKVVFAEQYQIA